MEDLRGHCSVLGFDWSEMRSQRQVLSRRPHLSGVLTGSLELLCRQQTKEEEGRSKGLVEATAVIQEREVGGLGQVVPGRWSQCLAAF